MKFGSKTFILALGLWNAIGLSMAGSDRPVLEKVVEWEIEEALTGIVRGDMGPAPDARIARVLTLWRAHPRAVEEKILARLEHNKSGDFSDDFGDFDFGFPELRKLQKQGFSFISDPTKVDAFVIRLLARDEHSATGFYRVINAIELLGEHSTSLNHDLRSALNDWVPGSKVREYDPHFLYDYGPEREFHISGKYEEEYYQALADGMAKLQARRHESYPPGFLKKILLGSTELGFKLIEKYPPLSIAEISDAMDELIDRVPRSEVLVRLGRVLEKTLQLAKEKSSKLDLENRALLDIRRRRLIAAAREEKASIDVRIKAIKKLALFIGIESERLGTETRLLELFGADQKVFDAMKTMLVDAEGHGPIFSKSLQQYMMSSDSAVAARAIELASALDPLGIELQRQYIGLLSHNDSKVRLAAAIALEKAQPREPDTQVAIAKSIQEMRKKVRFFVNRKSEDVFYQTIKSLIHALAAGGAKDAYTLSALLDAMADSSEEIAKTAFEALQTMDTRSMKERLLQLGSAAKGKVGQRAMRLLKTNASPVAIEHRDQESMLLNNLNSGDSALRKTAYDLLSKRDLSESAELELSRLVEFETSLRSRLNRYAQWNWTHVSPETQTLAVNLLGRVASGSAPLAERSFAISKLTQYLSHRDSAVRAAAFAKLRAAFNDQGHSRLYGDEVQMLEDYRSALVHLMATAPFADTRANASELLAIARAGYDHQEPVLKAIGKEKNDKTRETMTLSLAAIAQASEALDPRIIDLLTNDRITQDGKIRLMKALVGEKYKSGIGYQKTMATLERFLSHPNEEVRLAATETIQALEELFGRAEKADCNLSRAIGRTLLSQGSIRK